MKVTFQDAHVSFRCPGCGSTHVVPVSGEKGWKFNGDVNAPTLAPSLLTTSGHYCPGFQYGENCWCTYYAAHPDKLVSFKCGICHLFLREGKVQFLGDCTHALAGQTVELPEVVA